MAPRCEPAAPQIDQGRQPNFFNSADRYNWRREAVVAVDGATVPCVSDGLENALDLLVVCRLATAGFRSLTIDRLNLSPSHRKSERFRSGRPTLGLSPRDPYA